MKDFILVLRTMHLRSGYFFATDCGIVFNISSLDGQIFSFLKRRNIISIQLSNMEPTVESLIPNIYASNSIVIPSFSLTRTSRNCSSSDNAYLLSTDT